MEKTSDFISENMGPFDKIQNEWHNVGDYLKSRYGWIYDGKGTDIFGFSALPSGLLWAKLLLVVIFSQYFSIFY